MLAAKLEQALPGIASRGAPQVGGFRSKRREVRRIAVELGDEQFELLRDDAAHPVHAHKVVRGITLKREELGWPTGSPSVIGGAAAVRTRLQRAATESRSQELLR